MSALAAPRSIYEITTVTTKVRSVGMRYWEACEAQVTAVEAIDECYLHEPEPSFAKTIAR